MTIRDIMEKNVPESRVKIAGINSNSGRAEEYYDGTLSDIPEHLRDSNVLRTMWLIGAECNCILIPKRKEFIE